MVFRGQTRIGACLILVAFTAVASSARTYSWEVRQQHLHGGPNGTLRITDDSISFQEHGKKKPQTYQWRYEEIQQLTLGTSELDVLTYEDSAWKFGRDREFVFDHLPPSLAIEAYPVLARALDQRFIAAVPVERNSEWQIGAKLDQGLGGSVGTLFATQDGLTFETKKKDESRTWRVKDIDNISSTGPFSLTITTNEKSGAFRGGMRQFHFQLQQALSERRYNELWRRVNHTKGLTFLDSGARGGERQ
jgi:hypothetical protein